MPAIADRAVWKKVTKGQAGKGGDEETEKSWNRIEENQDGVWSTGEGAGYRTSVRDIVEIRGVEALRHSLDGKKLLKTYEIGMKILLRYPINEVDVVKLRLRKRDANLRQIRRYVINRDEEKVHTHSCPCCKAIESRTRKSCRM